MLTKNFINLQQKEKWVDELQNKTAVPEPTCDISHQEFYHQLD